MSKITFLLVLICALTPVFAQSPKPRVEVHVLRSLAQVHAAQITYQATTGSGNFGSLQNLLRAGFIDETLASGSKYGYLYSMTTIAAVPGQNAATFTVTATPRVYRKTGTRSFFVDKGGEIRGGDKNGEVATPSDPVIDICTNGSIVKNERCTITDMRTLHSAQMTYRATAGHFGLFPELYKAGLIRSDLSDYSARGYNYVVQTIETFPGGPAPTFKIWAVPQVYGTTAIRSFFIDQTGVLRGGDKNGGEANENDPPINE